MAGQKTVEQKIAEIKREGDKDLRKMKRAFKIRRAIRSAIENLRKGWLLILLPALFLSLLAWYYLSNGEILLGVCSMGVLLAFLAMMALIVVN
jgi:hypothetical protein